VLTLSLLKNTSVKRVAKESEIESILGSFIAKLSSKIHQMNLQQKHVRRLQVKSPWSLGDKNLKPGVKIRHGRPRHPESQGLWRIQIKESRRRFALGQHPAYLWHYLLFNMEVNDPIQVCSKE